MWSVTTAVVVCVVIVIIVISIIASYAIKPSNFESSRWRTFIITLASMSILLTALFYVSIVQLQQKQQKMIIMQETRSFKAEVLDVSVKELADYNRVIPEFVAAIYPLTVKSNQDCQATNRKKVHEVAQERMLYETTLSNKLFSIWEMAVLSKGVITGKDNHIICFLQWASSNRLYKMWKRLKINFTCQTVTLGDVLFEYGQKLDKHSPESYVKAMKQIKCDSRCKFLFN